MKPGNYDMDDLLIKYLLREATAEECRAVEEWLATSAVNQARYRQFKAVWEAGKQIAATSTVDEDAAWARLKNRWKQPSPSKKAKRPALSVWWRVAALFMVVAGAIILTFYWGREQTVRELAVHATGRVVSDTLPDGSVVTLNKNAVITYPERFEGESRPVILKGEAFFDVRPDKSKPFIVQVNDLTVQVAGTSFNIRSQSGITEVVVETGIVKVSRHKRAVVLHRGESTVVTAKDSLLVKQPVPDRLYMYYRTKEFVCDNTPLWKLVNVLNEAYNSNIVIERPELRSLPLTTTFHNVPLETILHIVSETLGVEVVKKADTIVIR